MGKVILFYNSYLLRNHEIIKENLWVQNGKIINPELVEYLCDESIDCGGLLISPGFIDLKFNGGFGHDFGKTADPVKAVDAVALELPRTGVTSFCPTLITATPELYKSTIPLIKPRNGSNATGATILGIHLDGPFISSLRPGAHRTELIRSFDNGFDTVKEVCGDLENVCLVTLAPELQGAKDVIKNLSRWGIKTSLGHSTCPLAVAEEAVKAGACMVTHLFNAMPAFHHRDPSLVGLLATDLPGESKFYFGLIADGQHTHPAALRMAYKIAPSSIFLVTDGVAPLGLGAGDYNINDVEVCVTNHGEPRCVIKDGDILFGSVATMDHCIRNLIKHTECSTVYALETATLHPALAMGLNGIKGSLDFGADADFVLLDKELLTVQVTYIAGKTAYKK